MAPVPSSRPRARCASTCHARAAAERANCAPLAGPAVAKDACGGRKPLTCASPRAWLMAGGGGGGGKGKRKGEGGGGGGGGRWGGAGCLKKKKKKKAKEKL